MRLPRLLPVCLSVLLSACNFFSDPDPFTRTWGSADAGLVDGAPETARFSNPVNVETAPDGTVYVADFDNSAIRVIAPSGEVSTLVHQAGFNRPFGLTLAGNGVLYVQTDGNDTGQRDATTGTIWAVNTNTGAATVVVRNIGRPRGLQALPDGRIALSDLAHNVISLLNPATGVIEPLAGATDQPGFADASGANARFDRPYGLALAADGALLVADQNNHRIRRVTLGGEVSTFAGTGTAGNQDDLVTGASFRNPQDVAVAWNRVYVSDQGNHVIRRIEGHVVTTVAGNGLAGFAEGNDDGGGPAASFFGLEGIAVSRNGGMLWMADGNNGNGDPYNRVRRMRF